MIDFVPPPRIERWTALGDALGIELYVARDDLLPFPLAGNKVRKLVAELGGIEHSHNAIVTNGAVDSNHCRTAAWLAAERGMRAHFVLHDEKQQGSGAPGLRMLKALGASWSVVPPSNIADELENVRTSLETEGFTVHTIPGGCHSELGATAYRDAALLAFNEVPVDMVFVPSGTGATQGGIVAAAQQSDLDIDVLGVSVARSAERGTAAVAEAAVWAGASDPQVAFLDDFTAGGYGQSSLELHAVVKLGWRYGFPLDETYTGKAFWAMHNLSAGQLAGKRVLFWHTGGLWNQLSVGVFHA